MQPGQLEDLVWVDADRFSGSPCFKGTRIPIQIDHLLAGYSLDEFLETVPFLDRVQTQKLIELAGETNGRMLILNEECVWRRSGCIRER